MKTFTIAVIAGDGVGLDPNPQPLLCGVDVHGIPAKGQEPYHLHHDLLFHFQAISNAFRVSEESHAVAWCAPAEFDRYALPGNVRRAYRRILSV